jgi:hypothetical protein
MKYSEEEITKLTVHRKGLKFSARDDTAFRNIISLILPHLPSMFRRYVEY